MKNIMTRFFIMMIIGALSVSGCRKGFDEIEDSAEGKLMSYKIKALYPDGFTKTYVENAEITLLNTATLQTITLKTNANGEAEISTLLPGTYSLNINRLLSAEEAAQVSPYNMVIFLNGRMPKLVATTPQTIELKLRAGQAGDLVIKQAYYGGSPTAAGSSYFSDQFYEIYNNSADTLYADSLCIADFGGENGINLNGKPFGFNTDPDYAYVQNIWMVPFDESPEKKKLYPIAPGKSIIIAQDGINHKTDPLGNSMSPVNLGVGIGDFETYVKRADNKDLDAPGVPNMVSVYAGSLGFDWLTSVIGSSVIIFRHPNPAGLPRFRQPGVAASLQHVQVPNICIIDAMEGLASAQAGNFKRIPASLDAGFVFCTSFVGEGLRRKVKEEKDGRKILQDTNNSSVDFEIVKPPVAKGW